MKACGLNTVETYVPWNLHEEIPGNFTFSGNLDLTRFLGLAQKEGLYVILRPGPYICAEWDLGGLPAWLLRDPNMELRTTYPGYLQAVDRYLKVVIPKILPYQLSKGGPVIMIQIENEYGSYQRDDKYLPWIKDRLLSLGVKELLFTSDGLEDGRLEKGSVKGELAVINDKDHLKYALYVLKKFQPDRPLMVGEYWSGWFDHWRDGYHHISTERKYLNALRTILKGGASVNIYMFHGGTNFGFWNGANQFYPDWKPPGRYQPTITSYDYNAPISESGSLTGKYYATCRIIAEFTPGAVFKKENVEETLSPPKDYGSFMVKEVLPLTEALGLVIPWTINKLVSMEQICDVLSHQGGHP